MFVTCLNNNSDKIGEPINNCLGAFINTSLKYMFIRSCLVSQPIIKLISNNERKFNSMDLLPIIDALILIPKLRREKRDKFPDKSRNYR